MRREQVSLAGQILFCQQKGVLRSPGDFGFVMLAGKRRQIEGAVKAPEILWLI